jgi:PAS domain-containing protein
LEGTVLRPNKKSLRASEQLFRSIFENAQLGIGIFKIESQEHISNHALQEMLGYSEKESRRLGQWDEALAGTGDKSRLSALGAAMSEFNYDVSLFKLDEIAKQYGANWKHSK